MIGIRRFLAVLVARNREFIRDRSSWAWNVIFPIMLVIGCLLYTSPSPRDKRQSRMPSSA